MFCSTPGCSTKAVQKCGNDCGTLYCSKKECETRHFSHAKQCIDVKITVDSVELDIPNDVVFELAIRNETYYDAIEFLRPFLNNKKFSDWFQNKNRFLKFILNWAYDKRNLDDTAHLLRSTHWDNNLKLYFINFQAGHKMTPEELLTLAVKKGYLNLAKLAIETGATNITTKLLYDSIDTNYSVSLYLIENGAQLDDACIDLALKNHKDVFLLDLIESENISLLKLLEIALRNNNPFFVSMAVKYGVRLDTKTLVQIVEAKDIESLEYAIKRGFEAETDFREGLMAAVVNNDLKIVELIYKTKPVNISHGTLMVAANMNNLAMFVFLLERTGNARQIYEELMQNTKNSKILNYLLQKAPKISFELFETLKKKYQNYYEWQTVLEDYRKSAKFNKNR